MKRNIRDHIHGLKSPEKASHNPDQLDEQLRSLVRLIARRAAHADFHALSNEAPPSSTS